MGETNIFKVLADSQRRDILTMLKNGRLNAGEIAEELQITPAALSYHLRLLKSADLVSEYKEKSTEFPLYYSRTDTINEIEDYYQSKSSSGKDYQRAQQTTRRHESQSHLRRYRLRQAKVCRKKSDASPRYRQRSVV